MPLSPTFPRRPFGACLRQVGGQIAFGSLVGGKAAHHKSKKGNSVAFAIALIILL